jgi:tyrosyl-tRNA synthetase
VKIGKSEGNVIGLTDAPNDLFGKIMSLGDDAIIPMFHLLTNTKIEEIESFDIKKDAMNLKKRVANNIVSQLYDQASADEAQENFINTFSKKEIPQEMSEIKLEKDQDILLDILVKEGIVSSKSDFRRLVEEGAVTNLETNEKATDVNLKVSPGQRFKIGKKRFIKFT